ncbi:MAG: ArsR family transcriptional regulator [Acidobacteriota bacterium]|nr:ArsR family transcriptional regulator [Acidobacteriota bacterium]
MDGREAKDRLYEQFARTAKALAHPTRVELLELIAQGEVAVEVLAERSSTSVTKASSHLQVLRRAHLVETRRAGTHVYYRLASDDVAQLVATLRDVSRSRLIEVDHVVRDYFGARDVLEPLTRDELIARRAHGDVVVLDVRPADEYVAGHIPGALSIPLDQLDEQLGRLPRDVTIVAYCRGPYCVLAPLAIEKLRRAGFDSRRLADGLPEWRLAALPLSYGEERRP